MFKKFFKDYRKFISKGNIVDLAVAVVIGGAFGKIVTSLVNDLIMPAISAITGNVSFSDLKWIISPANELTGASEVAIRYGAFLQTAVDFLIISLCIFVVLRILSKSQERIRTMGENLKYTILSKEDKKRLKEKGINIKDLGAVVEEMKAEEQRRIEAGKLPIAEPEEKTEDILKDIRTLLQNNKTIEHKATEEQ